MKTPDATNLNIRVSKKLLDDFWSACTANDTSASQVTRELMRAYLELCARAKGRRLPRLDLCGFEEPDQGKGVLFQPVPSLRKAAEERAIYKTGKTEPAQTEKR